MKCIGMGFLFLCMAYISIVMAPGWLILLTFGALIRAIRWRDIPSRWWELMTWKFL